MILSFYTNHFFILCRIKLLLYKWELVRKEEKEEEQSDRQSGGVRRDSEM